MALATAALPLRCAAQSSVEAGSSEWAVTSGGAVDLPGGARGGDFWAVQLRWGRVLTRPRGPHLLRGTLEYAVELVPAMILHQEGAVFGGGVNPLMLQYNFAGTGNVHPFIQMGGGMLWTTRDFPAGTSSFNFTPQGGIGAVWMRSRSATRTVLTGVVLGVRFHHTSNAGISKPNPGHNALYVYGGLSWWR
jgi:hypothetical protein